MKNIITATAQVTCGMLKGPCRLKETWWWNEEVAKEVKEKNKKYGNWKKNKTRQSKLDRVDKMQRAVFHQQRKRNRRNVQVI